MEAEGLCVPPRWACGLRGWGSLVRALRLGAAAGLTAPPRLHAYVDQGKAGGAPRCASSNSFLLPQNKEELLIPSTGEVRGQQYFVTRGAAAVRTACRQRLPRSRSVVLCQGLFKELLCGGKPSVLGCSSLSPVAWP